MDGVAEAFGVDAVELVNVLCRKILTISNSVRGISNCTNRVGNRFIQRLFLQVEAGSILFRTLPRSVLARLMILSVGCQGCR